MYQKVDDSYETIPENPGIHLGTLWGSQQGCSEDEELWWNVFWS
jgi:hypothetical protein